MVVTFDLRETLIPFSLLQITNAFRAMSPGEEMEILAGGGKAELAVLGDLMRVLPRADCEIVSREDSTGDEPVRRITLRKTRQPFNPKENPYVSQRSEHVDSGKHR